MRVIERRLDDGRDSARRRGASGRLDATRAGVSECIDMDVGVDDARDDRCCARLVERAAGGHVIEVQHARDFAAANVYGRGAGSRRRYNTLAADDQVREKRQAPVTVRRD